MEVNSEQVIDILLSLLGTAMLGLIGFVWKTSHRVSELEKAIEAMKELQRKNGEAVRRDIDYLFSKVEKQSDKMMSIARDIPKGR